MNNNTGNYKLEILIESQDMRQSTVNGILAKVKALSTLTLDSKSNGNAKGQNLSVIYYHYTVYFDDSVVDEIEKLIQQLGEQTNKAKMIISNEVKTISKITDVKGRIG